MANKRSYKDYARSWQRQCDAWLKSMQRNRDMGDVTYDYDQACLTLVPRTHYFIDSGEQQDLVRDLQPLCDVMDSASIVYDIRLDATYDSQSQCTIVERILVQLAHPSAVTELFLRVEREHLCLEGGFRTRVYD